MNSAGPARIVALLAALAGLCVPGAGQAPPAAGLLRIPKVQPVVVPADLLAGVTPLEELDTVWVASASPDALTRLRSAGVVFDELPAPLPGYAYYLVFDASEGDLEALEEQGRAFAGDDSIRLVLAPGDRPRLVIPGHLALKQVIGPAAGPIVLSDTAGARAELPPLRPAAAPNPIGVQLAAQVSPVRLARTVADLEGFGTRYASTSNCEAAGAYLLETFRGLGLAAESDYFSFGPATRYTTSNIVATLPGHADPARVVIVSAHYDSYSDQRETLAPGADDNASGVAAVVEAARLLSTHPMDFTVRFIGFGAEEWGLLGAQHYAQAARQRGEQIVGVINLDMIGYADRLPEDLDIVANAGSSWLADRMADAAGMPSVKYVRTSYGSDCSAFWQAGVASVCGIEDVSPPNPHYHKTTDRLETLNLDLLAAITRATVAAATDLAQPVGSVPTPARLTARSHVNTSLYLRARTVVLEWQVGGAGETGYHVYRASTSHGAYTRLNGAPVRSPSYVDALVDPRQDVFYVVTAVDAAGRESNYSGEARVAGEPSLRAR